jgi:hypothetical protein
MAIQGASHFSLQDIVQDFVREFMKGFQNFMTQLGFEPGVELK